MQTIAHIVMGEPQPRTIDRKGVVRPRLTNASSRRDLFMMRVSTDSKVAQIPGESSTPQNPEP